MMHVQHTAVSDPSGRGAGQVSSLYHTVDATKARDRINPVSLKVTKFSHTKVREIFKRYQVSLCLAFVTSTVPG